MQCPNCSTGIHPGFMRTVLDLYQEKKYVIWYSFCPECKEWIIYAKFVPTTDPISKITYQINVNPIELGATLFFPKYKSKLSPDVPKEYADDFYESSLVLNDSPKASAALSRRLLQKLLREIAKVKESDLSNEIKEVVNSGTLPSYLTTDIDVVRNIGNFAAHPLKDTTTGQIVDVEPGEAEWNLHVLEGLFDFYFVQPQLAAKRKSQLNTKLTSLGKPQIP